MIIFSVPKPFIGEFDVIQNNAIRSWLSIKPRPRIVLLGDEKGIEEVAQRYNIETVKTIHRNKEETPLLDSIFKIISSYKNESLKMFINSDIILLEFPMHTINQMKQKFKSCVIVGRRFEKLIRTPIKTDEINKNSFIKGLSYKSNSWIDYYIFTDNCFPIVPPFALGRTFWDKWLVGSVLKNNIPLIDGTNDICAIHQTHSYIVHDNKDRKMVWAGTEALYNLTLAGGWKNLKTISNATHKLKEGKMMRLSNKTLSLGWILDLIPSLWPFYLRVRLLRETIINRG